MDKVLLINDSVFENAIARDIIESIGKEVEISNEFEAFGAIDQFKPDIVISNYIMKRTTGDVLLQKIKHENPHIITVLSSSSNVKIKEILEKNIDFFLQIPVQKDAVEKIFNSCNEKRTKNESAHKFNFCPTCGGDLASLKINSAFCPYCGKKIES